MATFALPHTRWNYAQAADCIQAWHDAFIACGWVQTDDTGQISLGDAATKTTVGTVGWRVYKSTDPLSGQLPIFIKVGFNNISHGAYSGCLLTYMLVGFATDGAGTVAAPLSYIYGCTTSSTYPSATAPGALSSLLASGDGGSFRAVDLPGYFAYSSADTSRGVHSAGTFVVARTKDVNGNPTAEGVVLVSPGQYFASTSVGMGTTTIKPVGVTVERAYRLCPVLLEAGSLPGQVSTVDGQQQMQHPWACTPRLYPLEDLGFLTHYTSAAIGDILNIEQGAEVKKYIFIGRTGYCPAVPGSTAASTTTTSDMYMEAGFAMLWE